MRAIHLDRADAEFAPAKDALSRIEFAGFQERVENEGFERGAGALEMLLGGIEIVRGEDRAGCDVQHDESALATGHGEVGGLLEVCVMCDRPALAKTARAGHPQRRRQAGRRGGRSGQGRGEEYCRRQGTRL
jgi:hypothetical protein